MLWECFWTSVLLYPVCEFIYINLADTFILKAENIPSIESILESLQAMAFRTSPRDPPSTICTFWHNSNEWRQAIVAIVGL